MHIAGPRESVMSSGSLHSRGRPLVLSGEQNALARRGGRGSWRKGVESPSESHLFHNVWNCNTFL